MTPTQQLQRTNAILYPESGLKYRRFATFVELAERAERLAAQLRALGLEPD